MQATNDVSDYKEELDDAFEIVEFAEVLRREIAFETNEECFFPEEFSSEESEESEQSEQSEESEQDAVMSASVDDAGIAESLPLPVEALNPVCLDGVQPIRSPGVSPIRIVSGSELLHRVGFFEPALGEGVAGVAAHPSVGVDPSMIDEPVGDDDRDCWSYLFASCRPGRTR